MDVNFLFNKSDLIPAIVQDKDSGEVLMLAYMSEKSLIQTLETGKATFYSRSRQKIWCKGETSGSFMLVEGIRFDCDCDSLIIKVTPCGPACHTGNKSCFFRELDENADKTVM